jgi:hypothetical protein
MARGVTAGVYEMHAFDIVARTIFALAGGALMLLALGLVFVAGWQVVAAGDVGDRDKLG